MTFFNKQSRSKKQDMTNKKASGPCCSAANKRRGSDFAPPLTPPSSAWRPTIKGTSRVEGGSVEQAPYARTVSVIVSAAWAVLRRAPDGSRLGSGFFCICLPHRVGFIWGPARRASRPACPPHRINVASPKRWRRPSFSFGDLTVWVTSTS